MSRAVNALNAAWGWTGVAFAEVVAHSLMGHMLVTDGAGTFHYLDPELGSVARLGDEAAARAHMAREETQVIWRADALVDAAAARLGPPAPGEVFSLALPALLAGDYAPENLVRIDLVELIHLTGDLARQTRDLPDGAHVNIKVSH
ncbi:T6SS immunity protein Tdi1 domain-containing protein [Novosphingobium soli]|uniref:T6SS immunity protein Tdi1 domain-containing protein n=1 Tax=Novosphingobium soli TaxID=574956 RepID=A0ABV6CZW3_9SPHN